MTIKERFVVPAIALLALALAHAASAQELPVAPDRLAVRSSVAVDGSNQWRIGPLVLNLPPGWSSTSTPVFAKLEGPARSFSSYLSIKATPRARQAGYSLVDDPARGPSTFSKIADWNDCPGSAAGVVKPLRPAAATGRSTRHAP